VAPARVRREVREKSENAGERQEPLGQVGAILAIASGEEHPGAFLLGVDRPRTRDHMISRAQNAVRPTPEPACERGNAQAPSRRAPAAWVTADPCALERA